MHKTKHIFDRLNDGSLEEIKLEEMRRSGWGLFFSYLGVMVFMGFYIAIFGKG